MIKNSPLRIIFVAWGFSMLLESCSAVTYATSSEGTDLQALQSSVSRAELEKLLGECIREWHSMSGVHFCTFDYDAGREGDLGNAALMATLGIATIGMTELLAASEGYEDLDHITKTIVVSFDGDGNVLGIFDEYAILPEDGRSTSQSGEHTFE